MKKIIAVISILAMMFTFAISASAATINNENEVETMARTIPEGAFLYKEGLYIYESTISGTNIVKWELYSADGWCFYDLQQGENYDEEGNLLPAEERLYAQYRIMPKNEAYVTDNIISVPVQDGYEIVSVGGNPETA